MRIQKIDTRIKQIQTKIKVFRRKIIDDKSLNQSNIYLYKNIIQSAKYKINNILQIEDDLLSIEYSGYIHITNHIPH